MTQTGQPARKKLIEVALPLEDINRAARADKVRKIGTIRNLHKWFAPAPLPAWRALLFAALIDDPEDDNRRVYLLDLIKRLVANGADLPDQQTIEEAQQVIHEQFPNGVPPVMDPFCGGGSTLVEAQRLGLPTYGSDLNPVPVLITRTLTELLPQVYGRQPLHPEPVDAPRRGRRKGAGGQDASLFSASGEVKTYNGYDGLIRDVTYYAEEIRDQAWEQLKVYYPSQPEETPIAWLWARTATCPNPACGIETVLTTSWWLSKKKGNLAWIQPRVQDGEVHLNVISGQSNGIAPESPKMGRAAFSCLSCGTTLGEDYLRAQGRAGRLGMRMTAVSATVGKGRKYRNPGPEDLSAALGVVVESDLASIPVTGDQRYTAPPLYGITTWDEMYTSRQLVTLSTFADLVAKSYEEIRNDGGTEEWAKAVTTLLGLAVGRLAMTASTQTFQAFPEAGQPLVIAAFGRNDLPMMWDFVETFFESNARGDWKTMVETTLRALPFTTTGQGSTQILDARVVRLPSPAVGLVATDPPYFDAIGYADLSDYFYLWHRKALRNVHPDLFQTVAAPRAAELAAIPSRHGGSKEKARKYFIDGFTETFRNLQLSMGAGLPMLVIYASKEQSSGKGEETRWEAILQAMLDTDLEITGAWPIHMTNKNRLIGQGANTVAAYIVMVCRPRDPGAGTISLRDFTRALRRELPGAVAALQESSILPVDLPQAVLGPGMSIFSRYRAVLDQAGQPIGVGRAMRLISEALGEVLDEQQGELDPYSRFAVAWWESHGWEAGPFGTADQLARPQGIGVDDVVASGVATARAGQVRLLGREGLDRAWEPAIDSRPTAWEAVHHLADRLIDGGGQQDAAALMARLGDWRDQAQSLVYRSESIAARKGRAEDQERYNALIGNWTDLLRMAAQIAEGEQMGMEFNGGTR